MMSTTRFKVFANLYRDSVTLMQLAARLGGREGIIQASCLMATPANVAHLAGEGLPGDLRISASDLLLVVRGEPAACEEAIAAAGLALHSRGRGEAETAAFEMPLTSLASAVAREPDADLALISVPGDYAAAEAIKALSLGLHVMLFSDNVPIAEERILKTYARSRGRLMMGPDCGTAIINGVPLGFANVVRRGDIGLVAASGTGLQEVTCRIHNRGGGISQAIGTGGRDLHDEIGGAAMLQGLAALAADDETRVIVLISKPAAPAVAKRVVDAAAAIRKPVVVNFLEEMPLRLPAAIFAAGSLHHAADMALAIARGESPTTPAPLSTSALSAADGWAAAMAAVQAAVRGLFTGGTFCYEAQRAFTAQHLSCRSNAPAPGVPPFDGHGGGHVFLDLGVDEHTRGRPHPMIDPSPRDAAVRAQGADPETAVILFDVVLGFGSHHDPAAGLSRALSDADREARAQGRTLAMIGHVCGTDGDPQNTAAQVRRLERAGAFIADSNFEAVMLAAYVAARLAGGRGQETA
jgi:FdrA protein